MEKKALAAIGRHRMIDKGDNVIVALSGGADSVALFHFLLVHRDALGIRLAAAHFEHGLRGEDSLGDMAFVQALCERAGVPLYIDHGRMDSREKPKGRSTELWARQLRYAFFEELAAAHAAKIATAHTASDNAETVLLHAMRGTGPKGLAGIPPVRGPFIRPLLGASRQEILAYCRENRLEHVEDATNAQLHYTRNRLRLQALPLLEDIHPGSARALGRLAADMRALDGWLDAQAQALLEAAETAAAPAFPPPLWLRMLDSETLLAAPGPVRLAALARLAGPRADRAALERLEALLCGDGPAALDLPGGQRAGRCHRWLTLEAPAGRPGVGDGGTAKDEYPLKSGTVRFPGGYTLRVKTEEAGAGDEVWEKLQKKDYIFGADCDKISRCGVFRTRRPGDSFSPAGRGVTKPLKKWMNEAHIPPAMRAGMPLLTEGSRVLWAWGGGFCEGLAPDGNTGRLLIIEAGVAAED